GFRCLAFRDGDEVELRSRHGRPLARYFPEIVEALLALPVERFAVDGELVVAREDELDFPALMARLHPAASRVERLRAETPASFVAFDLLRVGVEELAERPFAERRERLEQLLGDVRPPLALTPATADARVAAGWRERPAEGLGRTLGSGHGDGLGAGRAGARRRGGVRPGRRAPLPPPGALRALAARPRAGLVRLRPARGACGRPGAAPAVNRTV